MDRVPVFCKGEDALAVNINRQAATLYQRLRELDTGALHLPGEYRNYFLQHHLGPRLVFSLQNSAHIIHAAVQRCGKPLHEICFLDYGAGLGTLFLLAGMMGFRKNIYNDYLPDWHPTARDLCRLLHITVDDFVPGDIDEVLEHAERNGLDYDIIASRNVVEHIYDLPRFYGSIHRHHPDCVVYSTTTANFHNPVMRWYHVFVHYKFEKSYYRNQRAAKIRRIHPGLDEGKVKELVRLTRGRAKDDFEKTITLYLAGKTPARDPDLRSNSCDCETGVWNEHLLPRSAYKAIIEGAGYRFGYSAGYWDTHYANPLMNLFARCMNGCIRLMGNRGVLLSPFINVTAYP